MSSSLLHPQHLGQRLPWTLKKELLDCAQSFTYFSASAHPSTLLHEAGLSAAMLPRLPGKLASLSSSHKRYGKKEGRKRGEGTHLALGSCWNPSSSSSGSNTFLHSQHEAPCPSWGLSSSCVVASPCTSHTRGVACPPSSHWVLIIALFLLHPSPRGGSFLQTLISQLPHFSMFVLSVF